MANCTDFCLSSLRCRILQDWSSTTTTTANKTCNFTGVTCKNFRVASIDLTNFDLNLDFESVSTYLVPLENLESLVLKNADLTGSVTSVARSQCGEFLKTIDLLLKTEFLDRVSEFLNLSTNAMDSPVIEIGISGFTIGL